MTDILTTELWSDYNLNCSDSVEILVNWWSLSWFKNRLKNYVLRLWTWMTKSIFYWILIIFTMSGNYLCTDIRSFASIWSNTALVLFIRLYCLLKPIEVKFSLVVKSPLVSKSKAAIFHSSAHSCKVLNLLHAEAKGQFWIMNCDLPKLSDVLW